MCGYSIDELQQELTRILSLTPHTTHELSERFNTSDSRIRKAINMLRSNGIGIVSIRRKGYFITEDLSLVHKQISSINRRIQSMRNASEGLQKYANTLTNTYEVSI